MPESVLESLNSSSKEFKFNLNYFTSHKLHLSHFIINPVYDSSFRFFIFFFLFLFLFLLSVNAVLYILVLFKHVNLNETCTFLADGGETHDFHFSLSILPLPELPVKLHVLQMLVHYQMSQLLNSCLLSFHYCIEIIFFTFIQLFVVFVCL